MPAAMTLINSQTLATAALTAVFSSIPSTYRDLRLIVSTTQATSATATDPYIRLNSDSGANYSRVKMSGNGSTASSNSYSAGTELYFDTWSTVAPTLLTCDFLDYAQTDKHKTILLRGNASDHETNAIAGRWASTSAISSMEIFCTDQRGGGTPDSWAAGSTFYLYGVSA